jgi:O-antigen/teichoic acid export membrane protein
MEVDDDMTLKGNVIINMMRSIFGILFPLVTFKYASIVLGPAGIGIANYSQSVISYFQLFATFGITTYAISEGSKIRDNQNRFNDFASEVFTISFFASVLSLATILIFSLFGLFGEYNNYILILGLTIFFTLIGVEWLFSIFEQFLYITVRSLVIQVLSLLLLFIFVKDKEDITIYIWLIVLATVGSSVFNYFKSRQLCKFSLAPYYKWKKHVTPMAIILGTSVASLIYVNSDVVVLGILKDDVTVGVFSAAIKVVKAVCVPIASIGFVVVPRIAESIAKHSDDIIEVENICKKVIDFMLFLIIPFGLGLYIMSDEAILLLSGKEFLDGSLVIKLLIIDIFLSPINGFLVSQLLVPFGKEKLVFYATIGGAVINLVLDFTVIPFFSLYGAAVATVVSEIIVLSVCLPFLLKKFRVRFLLSGFWQYLIASLPIIPCYLLATLLFDNYLLCTLFTVVLSGISYLFVLWLFKNYVVKTFFNMVLRKRNK